jgi:GR25 family glycosyltransferase involved in LPS biosynthesis/glycosyltransferase involved in cell wall biosynthesis
MAERQTLCLNMIVKNESHIIAGTLAHLCTHFTFSYWVISDTGSTDGTQDIIRAFFAERGIPGELTEDEWRDFGYNRTVALNHAYNKSDYLLVWDADDSIVGRMPLPTPLTKDCYMFSFGTYFRTQLVNNRKHWKYVGVLHEYITCCETQIGDEKLIGDYYCISGRTGSRNKDPNKYLNDALLLERGLQDEPTNGRYAFYGATSYRDAGKPEKAIELYEKTLTLPTWTEEKYLSCVRIYEIMKGLNREREGLSYLIDAHKHSPNRIEHILHLVRYYTIKGNHTVATMYYSLVAKHYEQHYKDRAAYKDCLFLSGWVDYEFHLPYMMIIASCYAGRQDIMNTMYKILFHHKSKEVSDWHIGNIFTNLQFLTTFTPELPVLQDMLTYCQRLRNRGFVFTDKHLEIIEKHIEAYKPLLVRPPTTTVPCKSGDPIRVMFTVTTCKRMDLFEQTMNSVLQTWTDISVIDHFFCVDDNSSTSDRDRMRSLYPFFEFHMKGPEERGHRESMNIIWRKIKELQPTYWIHMEDDWLFFQSDNYVTKSIDFLEKYKDRQIHQVLFNRNYAELYTGWNLQGGLPLENGYIMHEKSDAIQGRNCGYWPHYSFRPSMILTETILKLGDYTTSNTFFERDYADKWFAAGYRSGFFNDVVSKHIGKLTSDKSGANAYTLNGVGQFTATIAPPANTFVVNLNRRPDRRASVITEFAKHGITNYVFFDAVDGKELTPTPELSALFANNDFGSRRGVVGCALSHMDLWKRLVADTTNDYYTVFEDDVELVDGFVEKYTRVIAEPRNYDLLMLGFTSRDCGVRYRGSGDIESLDPTVYIGGIFGYIVTKQGAQKLLDYIKIYGIRHGIDYQMKITPGIIIHAVQPHIVLSDWVQDVASSVDSDIQRDFDSLPLIPVNLDEWTFYPGVDSTGYDIKCVGRKSAGELALIAETTPNCIAFNTLGFLKHTLSKPLMQSQYFRSGDGVYIRKNRPIRVKMLCNWCSSEQLCKEWNKMTKGNYTWNNIQLSWLDVGIDYYVIINKPPAGAYFDPKKTIVFQMEPWCGESWQKWGVKTWGEWARPDPTKFLHIQDHDRFWNNAFWQLNLTYTQLKDFVPAKTKSSIISSICSSKYFDPGHIKRIDFMKFIEAKNDPVVQLHIYNHDNQHKFKSYVGKADPDVDKEKGIVPYKYYFMCENNEEKNFITEKLWEPILTDTLCFYWGCPNVADWIDPRAFVQLNMDDFEGSFQTVKQAIEEDWWAQRLPFIRAEKKKILEYYSFMPTIERIIHSDMIKTNCIDTATRVCFIHSCHIQSAGLKVLDTLIDSVVKTDIEKIYIINTGIQLPASYSSDQRVSVIQYSSQTDMFELPTMRLLHAYAQQNPNKHVLYLHTKGISYASNTDEMTKSLDWTRFMLYALTVNTKKCVELLDSTVDTIGCTYSVKPHAHFSGNFWWSSTNHIAKLSPALLTDKMSAEWWVLSMPCRTYEIYNSATNHFRDNYPPEKYVAHIQERLCGTC